MSDIREMYQEMILEHNKKPRNFHALENPTNKVEGYNPLCGDRLTLYLNVDHDVVQDVSFEGHGCAIFKASASMMTTTVKGKSVDEIENVFHQFHNMVSGDGQTGTKDLGKLKVFSGVREYPARVKCATLAWHTLHSAVLGVGKMVSTE